MEERKQEQVAKELGRDSLAYDLKIRPLAWFPRGLPGGYHRGPAENKKLVALFPFFKLPWEHSSLPWGTYRDGGGYSRLSWVSDHNHITVIGRLSPCPPRFPSSSYSIKH